MTDLKILYVTNEMDPFLIESHLSKVVRNLAREVRNKDAEVRILMPKFGAISDTKNRLHAVLRLSGIDIEIGKERKSLIIKVSSIRGEKIQIYFIDNKDYFKGKSIFKNKEGNFLANNSEKLIFYSKGIIETMKQLQWAPNVMHCNGWYSALMPLYIKTRYKGDPLLKDTKVIYSIYGNYFEEGLLDNSLVEKEEFLKNENIINDRGFIDYPRLTYLGVKYADIVTASLPADKQCPVYEEMCNDFKIKSIPFDEPKDYIKSYKKIYESLLSPVAESV